MQEAKQPLPEIFFTINRSDSYNIEGVLDLFIYPSLSSAEKGKNTLLQPPSDLHLSTGRLSRLAAGMALPLSVLSLSKLKAILLVSVQGEKSRALLLQISCLHNQVCVSAFKAGSAGCLARGCFESQEIALSGFGDERIE